MEVNQSDQGLDFLAFASAKKQALVPGNDVSSDINYLHNVLRTCEDSKGVGLAVKTIMNAKIFVKEWPFVDKSEELRSLICRVRPGLDELECKFTRGYPPGEHIVISQYLTVGEIKVAVQSEIRDTYHIMDRATVIELEGEGVSDEVVLSDIVGSELWFKVNDIDFENELMYEGGKDIINMKCICKATDFDGERIGVCDECKVWQHTRCSGVDMSKKYSACASCLSLKQVDVPNITHDIFD